MEMATPFASFYHAAIADVDSIRDQALLNTSLSQLSKHLPQSVGKRQTMSLYLRWLEIHRQYPSKSTEHWVNTLLHWAQALRSRGFKESNLVSEVSKWKEENVPFPGSNKRQPPSKEDIAKAYVDGNEGRTYGERDRSDRSWEPERERSDSWRPYDSTLEERIRDHSKGVCKGKKKVHPDVYDQPPPGNYVCNRCGKRGHHLQACPTNMDPSYDRPPGNDYTCPVCLQVGLHYKSLCPKNTDPLCLNMKRKARGIKTPPAKGSIMSEWQKERDSYGKQKEADRLFHRQREPGRLSEVTESSNASSSSYSSNSIKKEQSPKLTKQEEIAEKLQELGYLKHRLLLEESVNSDEFMNPTSPKHISERERKRVRFQESSNDADISLGDQSPTQNTLHAQKLDRSKVDERQSLHKDMEMARSDSRHDPSWGRLSPLQWEDGDVDTEMATTKPFSRTWTQSTSAEEGNWSTTDSTDYVFRPARTSQDTVIINHDEIDIDSSDNMEVDELIRKEKTYSDFVRELLRRRPEMGETVNVIKRRPTAVDMWKEEDRRRLEMLIVRPEKSPSWDGFISEKDTPEGEVYYTPSQGSPAGSEQRLQVERILQFDGADDDKKVDENKTTPQRKTSAMGKLWETATNLGGLPGLKSPNKSQSGKAGNEDSPSRKKLKLFEGSKDETQTYSKDSFGSLLPSEGSNHSEVKATGEPPSEELGKNISVTTSVVVESERVNNDSAMGHDEPRV